MGAVLPVFSHPYTSTLRQTSVVTLLLRGSMLSTYILHITLRYILLSAYLNPDTVSPHRLEAQSHSSAWCSPQLNKVEGGVAVSGVPPLPEGGVQGSVPTGLLDLQTQLLRHTAAPAVLPRRALLQVQCR